MRQFRRQFGDWLTSRRATAILLLTGLLAALFPIPYLASSSTDAKDLSEAFPCQDRPCGCRTAEQCRKKCCCFTDQQKLSWARRNEARSSSIVSSVPPIETETTATLGGCCTTSDATARKNARDASKPRSRVRVLFGLYAQQCQGVEMTWTGQPIFVLPPLFSMAIRLEVAGESAHFQPSRTVDHLTEPPVPPPRPGRA